MKDNIFTKEFPHLKFWYVTAYPAHWLDTFPSKKKYRGVHNRFGMDRMFCTLEDSLSLRIAGLFVEKGNNILRIESGADQDNNYNFAMHGYIAFAETGKIYSYDKDYQIFKEDYYTALLSGLHQ